MSLLLPEKLSGGLFPDQCWLKRGRATVEHAFVCNSGDAAASVVAGLGAMLDAQIPVLRKGARVSLMLSDSFAALAALPWHAQLTAPEEIKGYAVACFERQGLSMNNGWVMHAEFRRPGSMGLAYALPEPLVVGVASVLEKRGLTLERLLPVSAWAYWRLPQLRADGQQLVVLREQGRIAAMVFDRTGLQGIDVEPVASSAQAAFGRLLRRVAVYYPLIGSVIDWSANGTVVAELGAVLAGCLPGAAVVAAARDEWS